MFQVLVLLLTHSKIFLQLVNIIFHLIVLQLELVKLRSYALKLNSIRCGHIEDLSKPDYIAT